MGKSPPYDLDLADQLEMQFDDEAVRSAMDKLQSNKTGKLDFLVARALRNGRGGTLRWPTIEQLLVTNPDHNKLSVMCDYAPRSEVDKLLARMKIGDDALLKEVRSGGFPVVRALQKPDRDRVFENKGRRPDCRLDTVGIAYSAGHS